MSYGEGDLHGRVEQLEAEAAEANQAAHRALARASELEAEKARMLRVVGEMRDLALRKFMPESALLKFCNMFIAAFGETEGGDGE